MKRTCKQCGREFELSASEIKFYESKGLDLPKRCKDCRAANKAGSDGGKSKVSSSGSRVVTRNGANRQAGVAVADAKGSSSTLFDEKGNLIDEAGGNKSQEAPRRETLVTGKSFKESGWPLGKLAATSIAAIAIVLVALFGATQFAGINLGGHQSSSSSNATTTSTTNATNAASNAAATAASSSSLKFRSTSLLNEHYEKHGKEMGFASAEEYQTAAAAVVANPNALHKKEAEDNDDVYFVEETGDFVIVSTDGYIRTYFRPDDGIAYYNRQ